MATNEKLQELVEDIRAKTELGKLKWSETAEPDEFIAVLTGAKFVVKSILSNEVDPQDGQPYQDPSLEIHRREDDALLLKITSSNEIPWQLLSNIHQSARHRALGVDDAVDEVLGALKQL